MKYIYIIFMLFAFCFANNDQVCKSCHGNIYNEYYGSLHANSSLNKDEIHKAVWGKHPNKATNNYICKDCHSPQVENESISCTDCHKISAIKEDTKHNQNILTDKEKYLFSADVNQKGEILKFTKKDSLFGVSKNSTGSPYHTIDYSNSNFYDGKMCMGCHSHNTNSVGVDACRIPAGANNNSKQNCITCHMPQARGSSTSIRITKTHAYHGFTGVHNASNMLAQYLEIAISQTNSGFEIKLLNKAPHPLLLQPLRVAMLKVKVNSQKLQPIVFARILSKDNSPAMPWEATGYLSDTMLKANEQKSFTFDYKLKSNDKIEAEFGFFIVNPKAKENLGLQDSKKANKYIVLKTNFLRILK